MLQAAGIRNVHDVMVALGFGAQALCPYAMMEKAMDGSPEPRAAAANVLEGLQKGMEKVLSTLGIHELRGYGRLVSAIGVAPEVLEVLAIPGFCASEGRGLGLDDLDELAEQGRQIRAGERPAKVKLPRMYPKVWKALARVATSERGYEELAETLDELEDEQPVALRHAVQPQLAPPEQRIAAEGVSSRVGEHELPFLISSMSFGSQGETAFRAYAEAAMRADMLCMNGEGGEIPDMYGRYPKHRGQQIASGRFGVSSLLLNSSEWIEIKIGQGAKPGEGGHLPGSKVTQAIARARNAQVGSDLINLQQPRPLLDRGPGPADRRAEDLEPARQGDREGARGARHRHDRHRHRQGGRRRHQHVRLRRHRRRPPARCAAPAFPARSAPSWPTTP